jgi:hypothetical protein
MDNIEIINLLTNNRGNDEEIAKIIKTYKPETSDVYDKAISVFNLSIKNIQENMEVAEILQANEHLASTFSTITRTSLLANNIKEAIEASKEQDDDDLAVEFNKI